MRRLIVKTAIYTMVILLLNAWLAEPSGAGSVATNPRIAAESDMTAIQPMEHLSGALVLARKGDLSFCLGYIRNSKDSSHDIANFILTWSPDGYRKRIPSVFLSKIDRVIKELRAVDYEQLIIDIDFIKNSQLTVSQMVRLIKRTGIGSRIEAK